VAEAGLRAEREEKDRDWQRKKKQFCLVLMLIFVYVVQYARRYFFPLPPLSDILAMHSKMNPPPLSCGVVVIGGGLAGLSAAVEAASYFSRQNLPSCTVTLLDKEPRIGGNRYLRP